MSKRYICKSKFHVCYHFLDIYENPGRKNFINPSCPKHCKIIHWNKKWHNFYFHTSLWCLRKVSSFWDTKKKCKNKRFFIFPLYSIGTTRDWLHFVKLPTYVISISLTTEIHKNNADNFNVTNKQYYKIILF